MKKQLFSLRILPCDCEVRGQCMCKEMPVIPVDRVVDKKTIIRKNVGLRKRRGTRGCWPQKSAWMSDMPKVMTSG
jgi:hypothetical protein